MRRFLPALLLFVLVGGGMVLSLEPIERAFIYFPSRQLTMTPGDAGLPFEDVAFTAEDGVQLHGWFVPGSGEMTWIWFHGNAGNIGHRVPDLRALHQRLGANLFIFDYRGYGRSAGTPSEAGLYRDAAGALAVVKAREHLDPDAIVYFGRSLGAAVAIDLATRYPPRGLVVEGVFSSIPAMARHVYPFLPIWPLLRTEYDSLGKIGHVRAPLLVIHAERDEVVPLEMGRRIFDTASEPKRFFLVPGAGHNDTSTLGGEPYLNAFEEFAASLAL